MAKYKNIMVGSIVFVYISFGLYQFSCILDWLRHAHVSGGVDVFVSGLLAYTPILGTIVSMFSVLYLYKLPLLKTLILFSPIVGVHLFVFIVLFVDFLKKIKR